MGTHSISSTEPLPSLLRLCGLFGRFARVRSGATLSPHSLMEGAK